MILEYIVDGQKMTIEEVNKLEKDKIIIKDFSSKIKIGYRPVEFYCIEKYLASEVVEELNQMEGEDLWYNPDSITVNWTMEDNFFIRTTVFKHKFIKE